MSHKGNTQLTVIFTATPDLVEEGDRIFESHAQWMEGGFVHPVWPTFDRLIWPTPSC